METLDVRGTPVDAFMAGAGRPLVYLHPEQFFDAGLPFLNRLADGARVVAPRHPGFGRDGLRPDIRSVGDLAYLYLDLLEQLDLRDVTLVGASLGGWIALETCVRSCERISQLVLIGSVGVKFSGREERDFADLFYLPEEKVRQALFANPERWAPDYPGLGDAELTAAAQERQAMAYYGWRPYMHDPQLKRWLHRVRVPTLVLWGEEDGFAPPSYGKALAESLPDARFQSFPNAGHYPQIERADAVAEAIASATRGR